MKQTIVVLLMVAALLVVGCASEQSAMEDTDREEPGAREPAPEEPSEPVVTGDNVEITAEGFSPETLTISVGDTVTWMNNDKRQHWPASADHPTHAVYPGSSITKCSSAPDEIFDSCRPIKTGDSWSFTFTEAGEWSYHDHLRPKMLGTIVVR